MKVLISPLALLAVLALAVPARAQHVRMQTRKLSGPMATAMLPSVEVNPLFDPSGSRLLYWVVLSDSGNLQLASAPSDQTASPVVLSSLGGPLVRAFAWTLDGTRAVYSAGPSTGDELYVVPADGSAAPLRIVPGVGGTPDHSLSSFALAGDGTHVVYQKLLSLYGVPLDGSAAPVLLSAAASVTSYRVSSALAVYHAGGHLFSVPVDGSAAPLQLTTTSAPGSTVFELTADGARAVWRANGGLGLWSVPIDGSSAPAALAPGLPAFATVQSFVLDSSGSEVAYLADANENERYELFEVPVDGSSSPALLVGVPSGGDVLSGFRFSPDGTRVVYEANTGAPIATGLYSTALAGGDTDLLFADDIRAFAVAPDSSRVVFSYAPGFQVKELHSVPLAGGASALLTPPLVPSPGEIRGFSISADSLQVVYLADAETWTVDELYVVPIVPSGPPAATKLNGALVAGGEVGGFQLAPDASHVVLSADAFELNQDKLFRAELAGAPDPTVFVTPLPSARLGDAYDCLLRNGRVVYAADQLTDGQVELFGVAADGRSPAVRLNEPLVLGGDVTASTNPGSSGSLLQLTPDGARTGYLADAEVDGRIEAYTVPSDGSSAPVKLNGALTSGTSVGVLLMSPDGTRWVYAADEQASPGPKLYSVPIGGGSATALASLASTSFSLALAPVISPDSTRVVYVNARLFSVPILGGTAVALSQASLQIQDFKITPNSARVVFRANASGAPSLRLYSSSITSGAQVVLSPTAVSGGNVTTYAATADSARVLFLGDLQADEHFLLYSVSSSSTPATLLHDPDLEAVSFQTAGSHVAYELREDRGFFEDAHFLAAQQDGSSAQTLLTDAFDDNSTSYGITRDGLGVVISDDSQLQVFPSAGGSGLQLHSGPTTLRAFLPGGKRVLFYAGGVLRSVRLTGGASVVHPVPSLVGKLQFESPLRWIWLGDADRADVVEVYTGFQER